MEKAGNDDFVRRQKRRLIRMDPRLLSFFSFLFLLALLLLCWVDPSRPLASGSGALSICALRLRRMPDSLPPTL